MRPMRPEPIFNAPNTRSRKGIKHSTQKGNPEGLLEKDIKMKVMNETPAGNKYKARHRSKMQTSEISEIVLEY